MPVSLWTPCEHAAWGDFDIDDTTRSLKVDHVHWGELFPSWESAGLALLPLLLRLKAFRWDLEPSLRELHVGRAFNQLGGH